MIWATVSSKSCFCWLYRASSSSAAKKNNQSDFYIDHLVMSMCRVISCDVGRGCLVWPVHSVGKTLLAFALLNFVLQGQTCLLLQVSLMFHRRTKWKQCTTKRNLETSVISSSVWSLYSRASVLAWVPSPHPHSTGYWGDSPHPLPHCLDQTPPQGLAVFLPSAEGQRQLNWFTLIIDRNAKN